jgi:trigger factor
MMKFTELKRDKLNLHMQVVVKNAAIEADMQEEMTKLSKNVKIDGFRPGKVPLSVLQKRYGNSVRNDVISSKVKEAINKIIKENDLNTVGDPVIDEVKAEAGKDLEFVAKFEIVPEIAMPDFKKISIEKPILTVSEKDVDEKINQLLDFSKKFEKESKGKAAKGDQVVIDAIGEVNGKAFEGGKLDGYKLVLGSGVFIPGFEDQLIGLKAGSEAVVSVAFPEDYHAEELAGKPAEFKVKVISIHKSEAPELNDEFVKQYGCNTVEELKERVGKMIENQYKMPINTMMKLELFNHFEKLLSFEVPKSLFDREFEILKNNSESAKKSDEILAQKSDAELVEYCKKLAMRRVRIGLMLAEYAKINDIKVSFDEIKNSIVEHARNFPGHEAEIFEYYKKNPSAMMSLQGPILEDKAVNSIFESQVTIKEKKYSKKDLEALLEKENDQEL